MAPLRNPQTGEEIRYNEIQFRTRQIVERTFGVWKRRFPCLTRGLTTKFLCSTTTKMKLKTKMKMEKNY
ncbi:uncharacterized protein LOC114874350 isoform X3 [Osmia bicornis bicornis]|uniref:uncharacterized protein LOC114874350 isoform X3 n=1 Tax=Osmia bicornis bicornis TaxID=1437191 RepID=UPI0010F8D5C5|nr:uncharacterized protein LOC114874350 isoform X3 [Osmia bicornis bicornis]